MLTRRLFTSCALCAVTGFFASEVGVGATESVPASGVTRTILQQTDGPMPGYVTVLVHAVIPAGATVARHTHPGIEFAFVLEGGGELAIQGQPARTVAPGEGFEVPANVPHSVKNGDKPTRVAATYVVQKDKPLASPAPE